MVPVWDGIDGEKVQVQSCDLLPLCAHKLAANIPSVRVSLIYNTNSNSFLPGVPCCHLAFGVVTMFLACQPKSSNLISTWGAEENVLNVCISVEKKGSLTHNYAQNTVKWFMDSLPLSHPLTVRTTLRKGKPISRPWQARRQWSLGA